MEALTARVLEARVLEGEAAVRLLGAGSGLGLGGAADRTSPAGFSTPCMPKAALLLRWHQLAVASRYFPLRFSALSLPASQLPFCVRCLPAPCSPSDGLWSLKHLIYSGRVASIAQRSMWQGGEQDQQDRKRNSKGRAAGGCVVQKGGSVRQSAAVESAAGCWLVGQQALHQLLFVRHHVTDCL